MRLFSATLTQTAQGRVRAENGSWFSLHSSSIDGGVLETAGSGVIVVEGNDEVLDGVALAVGAQLTVPCVRVLTLEHTIVNNGRFSVDASGCGPNFAVLRGQGGAVLAGAGELRLASTDTSLGARLDGSGGSLSVGSGQVLTGSGRMSGSITFNGVLAPDQGFAPIGPVGTLSLDGDTQLTLSGLTRLQIDLASAGSFDRIVGSGNVQLGGELVFASVGGFVPAPGSSFDVITAASVSGNFRGITLPPELSALDARAEVLSDRVRVHIIAPLMVDGFE